MAGALHHLGVSIGSHIESPEVTRRRGNFEAMELARLSHLMFEETWLTENVAFETRAQSYSRSRHRAIAALTWNLY